MQRIKNFNFFLVSVFSKPLYIIITIVTAVFFFTLSVWVANYDFVKYILFSDIFSIAIIVFSIYLLSQKMNNKLICKTICQKK